MSDKFKRTREEHQTLKGGDDVNAKAFEAALASASMPCTLSVGCDEAGVCYAEKCGEPERCPKK